MTARKGRTMSQALLPGVCTEDEVVRKYMRDIASRGGLANSPKQLAHRRRVMQAVNERRKSKE